MKILYGARLARFNHLHAVTHLASYITKWDEVCNRQLYFLVPYIDCTQNEDDGIRG